MHTEYFKRATFDVDYSIGTRINYDVPENVKPFLGDGSEVRAEFTFRPTNRMKIDQTYFLTRFRTRADSFPDAPTTDDGRPSAVFVNHLMRTKLNYQFTRELSLRFITDYNGNIQNAALTTSERQKRLTGDILLTYLVHPGTAFYVGYTNQRENLALFRGDPDYVERVPRPSVTTGRQLFVKASYLFRF
jgi:outer membrane receptor for ferrienterochelin and colicin